MNRVLVKPRRRICGVDGVIRGWRGGSIPTYMEYDATALKILIGRRKAGNVYIGRSSSLTWTGDMFTYNNAMYLIPAAMQPIKEFVELELDDELPPLPPAEEEASVFNALLLRRREPPELPELALAEDPARGPLAARLDAAEARRGAAAGAVPRGPRRFAPTLG